VFWAYMLRCNDGSFYLGHTDELEHRTAQHQTGELPCYTHRRRPVVLVWQQDFVTREDALAAERQIKGWNRAKKEALIAGDWRTIQRLAWGVKNPLPERLRQFGPMLRALRYAAGVPCPEPVEGSGRTD
jgi:predicted GIY-YIG superfamily endonuclease